MRCLLLIILVSYMVKCDDDSSYYVVEIPDETRQETKPFQVYWNVPTMQCKSKKIPFDNLYERYGIIQNTGDTFRGDEVAILYDPGFFPALLKNETSGTFKFRNGGVPQEGDLDKHWSAFRNVLEQSIPDPNFSGIGIIDFESWRPIFRQNFGVLTPYKDFSYQIERQQHWFWPEKAIQAKARQRFEEAARSFMRSTLALARELRARAAWGYYAYPYCFNAPAPRDTRCSHTVRDENDKLSWLWRESTALYPSTYLSKGIDAATAASLVRARVKEALRLKRSSPVLPYFWYRYRDGGYLEKDVLEAVLESFYNSNASGFIIWGSSNDVNTVEKCKSLLNYTEEVLGPAIAKYTKLGGITSANKVSPVTKPSNIDEPLIETLKDQTTNNNNKTKGLESIHHINHWFAIENNTQQITYNEQNKTNNITNANGNLLHIKKNTLLELLLNMLLYKDSIRDDESEDEIENYDVTDEIIGNTIPIQNSHSISTTESNILTPNGTSEIEFTILPVTKINPLNTTSNNINKKFPLTETLTVTTSVENEENNMTSIRNYTYETNFADFSSTRTQFTNINNRVSSTIKPLYDVDNIFDIVNETSKINFVNNTEENASLTDKVTELVFQPNITYEDRYDESSFINITTNKPTILENEVSDTINSFNNHSIKLETANETICNILINNKDTPGTDTVTEIVSDNNVTCQDKNNSFKKNAKEDTRPEYFFYLNNHTTPMSIINTNNTSTVKEKEKSDLSNVITSTYKPVTYIETSETLDINNGYQWYINDYSTSKDELITTTDDDKITPEDTIVESTSTVNFKDVVFSNDFTTEDALSSLKVNVITESLDRVYEKLETNEDVDFEEEELVNNEQTSPVEYIETKTSDNYGVAKNTKKGFHEDINFSDSTTENRIFNSFSENENLPRVSDENEATSFSGETTTDSVGVTRADFKIFVYIVICVVFKQFS